MPALSWIIIGGLVLTVGDVIFKFWIEKPRPYLYVIGLAVYLLGTVFLVQSFKSQNIAVASAVYIIINIGSLVLVSWFYFGEKLTLVELSGIFLALVAVVMLEWGK